MSPNRMSATLASVIAATASAAPASAHSSNVFHGHGVEIGVMSVTLVIFLSLMVPSLTVKFRRARLTR